MKKLMSSFGALAVCFMLTGCCLSHEWQDATCTEAKKCSKCEGIEGEALGHAWVEATCAEPKKCSVCGETEGEALPHTLTEANYQQAAVCTVCNAEVGEPLQADFEKYNLSCDTQLNKVYDKISMCYEDESKTTLAKVVFSNYRVIESDEEHLAKEGYEWKIVDVVLAYYDDNCSLGWYDGVCIENYYDIVGTDETLYFDENDVAHFSVNYNGTEYSECMLYETTINRMVKDTDDSSVRAWTIHCLVPTDYDGVVYGLRNSQIPWDDGKYIFDLDNTDTIFYRFVSEEKMEKYSYTNESELNLPYDVAVRMVSNFYMNMINYFDDETIGFFDADGDVTISQEESIKFLSWALDKYNVERSNVLSEKATILSAYDYLNGKLNVPETLYVVGE